MLKQKKCREQIKETRDISKLRDAIVSRNRLFREAAADNLNATEEILRIAIMDKDEDVRVAAVCNPNATEEIFKIAQGDKSFAVRASLAARKAAPEILKEKYIQLALDKEIAVRASVLNNPNADGKAIGLIALGQGEWKYNPATGQEQWVPQDDAFLRKKAIFDPRCPGIILQIASQIDPNREIRSLAKKRLDEVRQEQGMMK